MEYEHWNGSAADFCRQRAVSRGSLALWRRCCGESGADSKDETGRGIWIPADVDSVRPGVVGSLNFMEWRARPVMASSTPRPRLIAPRTRRDRSTRRLAKADHPDPPAGLASQPTRQGHTIPQLTGNLRHRELGFHPAPPKTRRTRSSTTLFTVFTLSAQSRGPLDGYVPRGQPAFRDRRRRSPSKDHPLRNPIR